VLIHQGQIGFIDFDGFCQAEPAMDLARFMATAKDVGLDAVFGKQQGADDPAIERMRLEKLVQIEELCEIFLREYEKQAPVSRRRVALWEALNIFTLVMSGWKKIKPARLKNNLLMLERQLSASGLYMHHAQNESGIVVARTTVTSTSPQESDVAAGLRQLAVLPEWLLAPLQSDRVAEALRRHIPELASGVLALHACKIKRMLLKEASGRWVGTYNLTVEQPGVGKQSIALRGTLTPPHLPQPAAEDEFSQHPFGTPGWRCVLPDLGLELELEPPETELPAMPRLIDPEESRALLEQGIRACSPGYGNLQIAECRPEVLSYKPGSR